MRNSSWFIGAGVALWLAVLPVGPDTHAAPGPALAPQEINDLAELDRLPPTDTFRLAYEILGPGKRNYLGHRGGAMTEIETAAHLMGVEIGRKIQRAHDDQAKSDDRMRLVQLMLQQVRGRLLAEEQKPVLEHVDKALAELTKALKIRAVEDEQEPTNSQLVEVPATPAH